MNLVTLGIKVTNEGVKESATNLDKLGKSGDQAARSADRVRKSWEGAGRALGVAAAAGFAGAAAFLRTYVQNTIEAERVQAQLEARLKSTRGIAGLTAVELNKMASALQAATTFDDEGITEAQSLLLTFTKIGRNEFPRATEAVLDMSVALGTDLKSAALQVGKALNDPVLGVTALARAGVQFSDSQRKIIKDLVQTGRQAEAQAIILRELETQMGGSARAARDTLGGALQALRNNFDNLLEGESGGLRGTREQIEALNRTLTDPALKRGVDTLASGLITVANAALQATGQVGSLIGRYTEFLANRGFLPANEGRTLEQLQTRQQKLREALGKAQDSPILYGRDTAAKIQSELDQIDKQIAGYPFRNVVSQAFGPPVKGSGSGSGGGGKDSKRKARELPDFSRDAREELQEQLAAIDGAREQFDGLAATLAGPVAEAQHRYAEQQRELNELARVGEIDTSRLAEAHANLAKERDAEIAAIQRQLDPGAELLDQLRFEQELLKLGTAERAAAIQMRGMDAESIKKYSADIVAANKELQSATITADFMDDFKRGFADAFADFASGAASAKDAFGDLADYLFKRSLQLLADQALQSLFKGVSGSGSTGTGGWAELFGSLFGGSEGGYASGGYTGDGARMSTAGIVHKGEYVIDAANVQRLGRGYLDQIQSGGTPGSAGVTNNTTFVLPRVVTQQTQAQIAQRTQQAQSRATSRNR